MSPWSYAAMDRLLKKQARVSIFTLFIRHIKEAMAIILLAALVVWAMGVPFLRDPIIEAIKNWLAAAG